MNLLFATSRIYYAFRQNYYHWGHGPILDETGAIIGKYHIKYKPKRIEFQELDGKLRISLIKKKLTKKQYEIEDEQNKIIARIKKKFSHFYVENKNGEKIMEVSTKENKMQYNIIDSLSNLLAEVYATTHWPKIFQNVIFEFGDTFGVKIIANSVDRRLILGLVIVIDYLNFRSYINSITYTS